MLKDLGFIEDFHRKGLIRLNHPELIIEFLVPEKGRGRDTPYPLHFRYCAIHFVFFG